MRIITGGWSRRSLLCVGRFGPKDFGTQRYPEEAELICISNNEGSRQRLASFDDKQQTFTINPNLRTNPQCFGNDWALGRPEPGKACP